MDRIRRYHNPGKFQGGLLIDEAVYELSLQDSYDYFYDWPNVDSYIGMYYLDDLAPSHWNEFARASGFVMNYDEIEFLLRQSMVAVESDTQGFITVTYFETSDEGINYFDQATYDAPEHLRYNG
jgi:hypothetical protein